VLLTLESKRLLICAKRGEPYYESGEQRKQPRKTPVFSFSPVRIYLVADERAKSPPFASLFERVQLLAEYAQREGLVGGGRLIRTISMVVMHIYLGANTRIFGFISPAGQVG
jgi:hypothetical protein